MLPDKPALYTDLYELTMAQGYFLSGTHSTPANFDYFFRSLPFKGGFVIFAGLDDVLKVLKNFRFHSEELNYLKEKGFRNEFLDYLEKFSFKGNLHSVKEGEIVFPNEPILQVQGSMLEAQLLETLILNLVNFESLIATKTARICQATDKAVVDFGLRRAHGTGGMQAAKAAVIGGAVGTSNVLAGFQENIPISGTMAHSWIQFFGSELEAFRKYAEFYPDSTILLVDTYDTLKSGVPNAIKVAKELEQKGHRLAGVRLDSGDLAYLAKETRKILDAEGLRYVKILVSNKLDEYVIKSLTEQGAPIDMFGVGTKLITAYDDPALDGVYKLSVAGTEPVLKISENISKTTLPAKKKVLRFYNEDNSFNCDGIYLHDEEISTKLFHPYKPVTEKDVSGLRYENILHSFVENGEQVKEVPSISESAEYAKNELAKLNSEHKRFDNPHEYKVGVSRKLLELRNTIINKHNESAANH